MPAAKPLQLTDGQRWQLEKLRGGAKDARLVLRALVILMTADRKPVAVIRETTGLKRGAIAKWRTRYRRKGLEGLYDLPRSGRTAKATEVYLNRLRRAVMRSPQKSGSALEVVFKTNKAA